MWEVPPSVVNLNFLGNVAIFWYFSLSLTCDCLVVNKSSTLSNSFSNILRSVVKNVTDIT